MKRLSLVATIAAGLLFGTSCSKTEDTSPETRLFGQPPQIQNVSLTQVSGGTAATCEYGLILQGWFCGEGYALAQTPTITLTATYSALMFNIVATDSDSVPGGQSDILLVAASYLRSSTGGTPVETSIVALDDGGTNKFSYSQQGDVQEDCELSSFAACSSMGQGVQCGSASYDMSSNDSAAGDGTFSRGFALVSGEWDLIAPTGVSLGSTKKGVGANCIAQANAQFPAIVDIPMNQPVSFKIEVVDRAGNLAVWPTRPEGTFTKSTLSCTGDDCGCCFLLSGNPVIDCRGRDGLQGALGTGFEGGFCHSF